MSSDPWCLDAQAVALPASQRPILVAVVDTEEEFDWNAPVDRGQTSVSAMKCLGNAQSIFDQYGIRPVYAANYAVVSQEEGWKPLAEIHASGRCEIGAHLHTWVTPPLEEPLIPANTFQGNLPSAMEWEKLRSTTFALADRLGAQPKVFKAGRYGIGRNTIGMLDQLGYETDMSVAPGFDYAAEQGPDFLAMPAGCAWVGPGRRLLEIPCTGGFTGWWPASSAAALYRAAASPLGMRLRAPGILARSGAVDRIRISPEAFTHTEHRALTGALLQRRERVFSFSFHSTSLEPGHTPYVRTAAALSRFLDSLRSYFDYFFGELNGITMTPSALRSYLLEISPSKEP
jgi:hypothetical protein